MSSNPGHVHPASLTDRRMAACLHSRSPSETWSDSTADHSLGQPPRQGAFLKPIPTSARLGNRRCLLYGLLGLSRPDERVVLLWIDGVVRPFPQYATRPMYHIDTVDRAVAQHAAVLG